MINVLSNHETWSRIAEILWNAEMGYNKTLFWMYMIGFLCVYLLLEKSNLRKYWILIGSTVFYIWSGIGAVFIVAGTAIIVYLVTRKIEKIYEGYDVEKEGLRPKEQTALFATYKKKATKYLWIALCSVISIWVFVKVAKLLDFNTVESLKDMSLGLGIIVPLGISYYSLSAVGYVLDVYWRKAKAEHNFLNLFSAMIYFPHIVQGPISKYTDIMGQMNNLPKFDYQRVCFGLQLMLWGYIKKMIIADRLVIYTGAVFANPAKFAGVEIFIAVILCAAQLYADFSGCMDIVRGISQVIGIDLAQNFRQPFFAKDAQEFWSRWHITLGAWTKDYIYLPIAMNPKFMKYTRTLKKEGKAWKSSFIKAFVPLITVWIFTGLWHGTGFDYLMWGLYWCTLMTLSKELKPFTDKCIKQLKIDDKSAGYQLWRMVRTGMLFAMGRMITVTGVLTGGLYLMKQMVIELRLWTLFDGSLYTYGLEQKDFYVAVVGLGTMLAVDIMHERGIRIREGIAKQLLLFRWGIYYLAIIAVVVFGIYGPGFDAASFVYGAF